MQLNRFLARIIARMDRFKLMRTFQPQIPEPNPCSEQSRIPLLHGGVLEQAQFPGQAFEFGAGGCRRRHQGQPDVV